MATVTVLKFPSADGADQFLNQVRDLQRQHLLKLHDAAIVSWPVGKSAPKTRQLLDLVGVCTLGGMFWGMLFGSIFLTPLFGLAAGGALGALSGAFRDYGIDDEFIKQIRTQVTEGTSAIFLMTSEAVVDRIAQVIKDTKFDLIATNLSAEQEQKLRAAFGAE